MTKRRRSAGDPTPTDVPGAGDDAGSPPETRRGLRARAVHGVFWTATSNWGNELSAFLVFAILSRLLDPEAFGLVALALVFVGFASVVADQGLTDALIQRKDLDDSHLDAAFWMSVALGVFAVPISAALGERALAPVLVALGLTIPIGSSALVQRAILTRELKFRSLALRTLVSIAVGSVIGVGAAFLGAGVWSLVAMRLATEVAAAVVLWRVVEWRPRFRLGRGAARELFHFGKHVVGYRLLNYANRNTDNLIIGAVLGPVALGFYTVGYRLLKLVLQITTNLIDSVAYPLYARLQHDPERFRRAYYKSTSYAALIAFPSFVALIVLAPELVSVLFGPKWADSVPVMQVLALLGIVRTMSYLNTSMLTALGKPSWRFVIFGITTTLSVVAYLLVVQQGIVAVAWAATAVGCLIVPISYGAVNRLVHVDVRAYVKGIGAPFAASLVMAGSMIVVGYLLGDKKLLTLVVASLVGALVYLATIEVLAPRLGAEARQLVRYALPRPMRRRQMRLGADA
jgi:PST family polysaccharide transporter